MTGSAPELAPPGGWRSTDVPRIVPLTLPQLGWPLRTLLVLAGQWGRKRTGTAVVPDVFLLLMRQRRLFWPWLRFASRLMPYGTLDRRDAELVILRVGWNCRCRYEWGQHVQIGLRAGLSAQDIARIAEGPDAPGWTPRRSALLQAADDLHRAREIAAATWQRLAEHYTSPQLIEIGMLIGHYEMLAGVLNSVGLPLETHTDAALAQTPGLGSRPGAAGDV
ncbi:carboxymuconolactone decarboxylase family protein [Sinimarinibacterium sp. NLF-5-8]|uniref:carboxymuconolactone decarboxylase family protein n=1 Tax=Sinimarinibacterium sp. NLF-5-8 TaxID=2698684 RepID=UPI00137BB4E7|nr:carboxymuconolactone decarboxylase family protein [Sinimarinibacterium sp. NLF-5-8]QHS10562.1 carboxymuconolactone decarboxylase family protein [Sinimarinibacterium sp. NLF-5-8]